MRRLFFALPILALAALPASPRVMVVFRLASPPLPAEPGQQFTLCAANVGSTSADFTLEFLNVRSGAIVAQKDVVLPPPGASAALPDPCLLTTAETVTAAAAPSSGTALSNEPTLVAGLVIAKRGFFARAIAATASIQVTAPGPNSTRQLLASVPLVLATMTNGRNTPIEVVK